MSGVTERKQRSLILAAYVGLFIALAVQALYFVTGFYFPELAGRLHRLPALCFGLVVLSGFVSILIEQRTRSEKIRDSAESLINIILVMIVLGIFSAIQSSSWWRIENKSVAALVNVAALPAVLALMALVVVRFQRAR